MRVSKAKSPLYFGRHRVTGPRHAIKKRLSTLVRTTIALGSLFVAAVFGVAAVGITAMGSFDSGRAVAEGVISTPSARPADPVDREPFNILIMGSDTRGRLKKDPLATGNRSDVMMILHVSGDRENIHVMSIPRDTWVPIKGHGEGKINWALSFGGVPLAVKTVERFLDIHIDHVAVIDFNGVKKLTKILGGVTLDNPVAFSTDPIADPTVYHFDKGTISLNGGAALAYVRERHAFAQGDVARVENQQRFVGAMIDKILSLDVLTNPGKLVGISGSIGELLVTDEGIDSRWILSTALELSNIKSENVNFFTMPIETTRMVGSQYAVIANIDAISRLSRMLNSDSMEKFQPLMNPEIEALDQ